MATFSPHTFEISQDIQAEIEEIAAYLSQMYGFDFPLDLIEGCYKQVQDVSKVRMISERVRSKVNIDPDDFFDDEKTIRHMSRLDRAFQHFIDEHLS